MDNRSGGKRNNSGRKKGSSNKDAKEYRNLLEQHKEKLIEEAVKMALDGNAIIMNKLLDKMLPSLTAIDSKVEQHRPIEIKIIDA